jgi:hypothetical protein
MKAPNAIPHLLPLPLAYMAIVGRARYTGGPPRMRVLHAPAFGIASPSLAEILYRAIDFSAIDRRCDHILNSISASVGSKRPPMRRMDSPAERVAGQIVLFRRVRHAGVVRYKFRGMACTSIWLDEMLDTLRSRALKTTETHAYLVCLAGLFEPTRLATTRKRFARRHRAWRLPLVLPGARLREEFELRAMHSDNPPAPEDREEVGRRVVMLNALLDVVRITRPEELWMNPKLLRSRLQTAVCQVALGPTWRSVSRELQCVVEAPDDRESHVLLDVDFDLLCNAAGLTPGERDAVEARRMGFTSAEHARTRGVEASTQRNLFSRALRKLHATASHGGQSASA